MNFRSLALYQFELKCVVIVCVYYVLTCKNKRDISSQKTYCFRDNRLNTSMLNNTLGHVFLIVDNGNTNHGK